jgi:hypothetical protein
MSLPGLSEAESRRLRQLQLEYNRRMISIIEKRNKSKCFCDGKTSLLRVDKKIT